MHRIANLNVPLIRSSRGAVRRARPRGVASSSSSKTWMSSAACAQAPSAQAPMRVFGRTPTTTLTTYRRPSRATPASQHNVWDSSPHASSSRLRTSTSPLEPNAFGSLVSTRLARRPSSSRSFHVSSRREGHPILFFLIPLLKTSASLTVIKTGRYSFLRSTPALPLTFSNSVARVTLSLLPVFYLKKFKVCATHIMNQ